MVEPFLLARFSVVILIFSNMSFTDPVASIFSPGFRKERHYVGIFSTRLALSVGSLFCHFRKFTNYICWVCKHRHGELPFAVLSKNVFERAVYKSCTSTFSTHISTGSQLVSQLNWLSMALASQRSGFKSRSSQQFTGDTCYYLVLITARIIY